MAARGGPWRKLRVIHDGSPWEPRHSSVMQNDLFMRLNTDVYICHYMARVLRGDMLTFQFRLTLAISTRTAHTTTTSSIHRVPKTVGRIPGSTLPSAIATGWGIYQSTSLPYEDRSRKVTSKVGARLSAHCRWREVVRHRPT